MDRIFQYYVNVAFAAFRIDRHAVRHFAQTTERRNCKTGICRNLPHIHKMRVFKIGVDFKDALAATHTHVNHNHADADGEQRNPNGI